MARAAAAGNRDSYIGFYIESGGRLVFCGGTPSLPTAGQSSGMREVLGVKTVALTTPEPESVQSTGDDILIAEFEFDSITARRYLIDVAVYDMQLEAYLQSSNVVSRAGGDWGVGDVDETPTINIALIHQSRAVKYDANNKGQKAWQGVAVPLASGRSLGRVSYDERGAAVYRLSVVSQLTSYSIWGETLADTWGKHGARQMPFRSDYPYHIVSMIGDNSETDVTLDHRPVDVARSAAFRDQGIPLTINSVNRATRPYTATLSAAPGTNVPVVVPYQYDSK